MYGPQLSERFSHLNTHQVPVSLNKQGSTVYNYVHICVHSMFVYYVCVCVCVCVTYVCHGGMHIV